VKRLLRTIEHDWKRSRKLPLSDQAVQADLEGHGVEDLSRLALDSHDGAGWQCP
jgi:cardiolipin synthase A/B